LSGAVDTAQLASDAITAAKIAADAVGEDAIAANAIGSAQVQANAIDATNIVAGAIGSSEIAANSIGSTAIVAGAIGSSEIAANSIGTNAIISDAIDSSHISANSIDSNMIVAGTINSSHIAANSITAAAVVAGSITNSEIQGNTINSAVIQAGAVDTPQIAGNAITSAKIAAGAVDTAEIAANAITNAKIEAGTIGNAEISSSAGIGFAKISVADGDIDFAKIDVADGDIDFAKVNVPNGSINTAVLAANVITNAKISSTDNMTITLTDGTAGGWAVTSNQFSSTNASGGGNAAYTTAGIRLGAAGFISAKNFYIDTAGNAKFKGELAGATGTFSGSLSVAAFNSGYSGSDAESDASAASSAAANAATTAGQAYGQANTATTNAANADTKAGQAYGQANTATTNAANADTKAGQAYGQANTATTNAANADTKAGQAYGQANTATTNAANADTKAQNAYDNANSKVTHASVNASSTIVGGGIGGWNITQYHLAGGGIVGNYTTGTSTSGNATFLTTGGILLGSDGFISANQFYVDTAGNAKFKGTLEGNDVTVNGTLVLPSDGGSASGASIGGWSTNIMANKRLVEIGSGAGFYQGYVRLVGNTNHVKTVSIQVRTGTSNSSQGSLVYETPQLHQYTAGNLLADGGTRIYSSSQTANMPIAFTYSGSSALSVYIRAQADTGLDYLGTCEARFLKFGTTDPVFGFANQTGVALSTAIYSNTQVTGGFAGTKTVSINNTSYTRFKIDNGSFGTANTNIANGSYINVEITSASSNLTQRTTTVTIGNTEEEFSVTTGGTSSGGGGGGLPPGGGGGCFVQGTPVVMADGSLKAIEDVTAGESVKSFRHSSLSLDENAWETWTASEIANGSFGTSNVVEVTDPHSHTNYYWINYNLKVTNEHPMLSFKDDVFKFIRVEDLAVGDILVRENGTLEEIFAMPRIYQDCITHNMDVEDDDTYVVRGGNGIGYIAHNVSGEIKA